MASATASPAPHRGSVSGETPGDGACESRAPGDAKERALSATDFFTPYTPERSTPIPRPRLGAPVLLPSQFGTPAVPHLVVQTQGGLRLPAQRPGPRSRFDGQRRRPAVHGPVGGAWATPGVWPGNGAYIYIPTAGGGSKSLGTRPSDFNVFNVSGRRRRRAVPAGSRREGPQRWVTNDLTHRDVQRPDARLSRRVDRPATRFRRCDADLRRTTRCRAPVGPRDRGPSPSWRVPVANATKFVSPGLATTDSSSPLPTAASRSSGSTRRRSFGPVTAFSPTTVGHSATTTLHFTLHRSVSITRTAGSGCVHADVPFAVTATSPAFVNAVSLRAGQVLSVRAIPPTAVPEP